MSASPLNAEAARRLASFIDARRAELAGSLDGDAAAVAAATRFLERLSHGLRAGDAGSAAATSEAASSPETALEQARIEAATCALVSAAYITEWGFSDDVMAFLTEFAAELEARARNDRRVSDAKVAGGPPLAGHDAVVRSLLSAIEVRDAATFEHSRAVGMWCGRIAKTMRLDAQEQALAALAGTLHDVGKIATATEILLKPGPLDTEQWQAMRDHVRIGEKMLARIPSLEAVAAVVRAHHERTDGRGYPDGLAGDAIPLVARIVAVADSFHAMISVRPYREALPVAQAMDELRAGTGTQFDSGVVTAMLDILQPSGTARAPRTVRAVHFS